MAGNPRRRHHHRRHRRHHYRGNPGGPVQALESTFKHPGAALAEGGVGIVAAYMTVAIPNWLLPFPGTDLMSKVLRGATRVAAGGLVSMIGQKMRYGAAAFAGASIGAVGSTVLDLLGTRVILGQGDTGQTPTTLLTGLSLGSPLATAGYVGTRSLPGSLRGYVPTTANMAPGLRGYSPQSFGAGVSFHSPTGVIPAF